MNTVKNGKGSKPRTEDSDFRENYDKSKLWDKKKVEPEPEFSTDVLKCDECGTDCFAGYKHKGRGTCIDCYNEDCNKRSRKK
jgi:hypothetical protein